MDPGLAGTPQLDEKITFSLQVIHDTSFGRLRNFISSYEHPRLTNFVSSYDLPMFTQKDFINSS